MRAQSCPTTSDTEQTGNTEHANVMIGPRHFPAIQLYTPDFWEFIITEIVPTIVGLGALGVFCDVISLDTYIYILCKSSCASVVSEDKTHPFSGVRKMFLVTTSICPMLSNAWGVFRGKRLLAVRYQFFDNHHNFSGVMKRITIKRLRGTNFRWISWYILGINICISGVVLGAISRG